MNKRVIGFFNNWITLDDVKSKYEGYTDIAFSYWVSPSEINGAAEALEESPEIRDFLKEKGVKTYLAAGGDTLYPLDYSASDYGIHLSNYAIEHGFDGVMLDFKHFRDFDTETVAWLVEVTMAVKSLSIIREYNLDIIHVMQANKTSDRMGLIHKVENKTHGIISQYIIQYYNCGTWGYQEYESYDAIFLENYDDNGQLLQNNTSIQSLNVQSIPADKLIIGKPITINDVYNTGYVAPEELQSMLKQAIGNNIQFGGVAGWKVDSDINGEWGKSMSQLLKSINRLLNH